MIRIRLPILFALIAFSFAGASAAPVSSFAPKEARRKFTATAESYRGTPYKYGGIDSSGLDCSGLVYLSLRESLNARPPRTTRELYAWSEPVGREKLQPGDLVFFDTTGPLTHVGIYVGENLFVHSASDGPTTGVIISSLDQPYWRRFYMGAGRVVPPAEYLGLQLSVGGGAMVLGADEGSILRGAAFQIGVAYEFFSLRPGVELRTEWDASLGVVRVPLVLSLGIGDNLRFFVGPALVLGDPEQDREGAGRAYEASGGLLASGGVSWSPFTFRTASSRISLFGELAWQRFEPSADQNEDAAADAAANLRASVGFRIRWGL